MECELKIKFFPWYKRWITFEAWLNFVWPCVNYRWTRRGVVGKEPHTTCSLSRSFAPSGQHCTAPEMIPTTKWSRPRNDPQPRSDPDPEVIPTPKWSPTLKRSRPRSDPDPEMISKLTLKWSRPRNDPHIFSRWPRNDPQVIFGMAFKHWNVDSSIIIIIFPTGRGSGLHED